MDLTIDVMRLNTKHFLRTRYLDMSFRTAVDRPWRTGADIVRHFEELSDDDVRVICDDILNDLEARDALA